MPSVLVLLIFGVLCLVRFRHVFGDDLTSSYLGCQVLAAGEVSHLYSQNSEFFTDVNDPVWTRLEARAGMPPNSAHPYVQTPLWAYSLRPLCGHTSFTRFRQIALAATVFCLLLTMWLVARFWAPGLLHPAWLALLCVALFVFHPFAYAFHLVQTHILFVALTVLALVLARLGRPIPAGFALALAAAVKITPGFLLLYWLLTRQRKAAASFVVSFLALTLCTYVATGRAAMALYLREMAQTSNMLLVSYSNQSLAAWWMAHRYAAIELFRWKAYPIPGPVKAISLLLVVASAVAGGLLDRRAFRLRPASPPYGAVLAMIGATIFNPIAWAHYYILLLLPLMLLVDAARRGRKLLWGAFAAAIYLLNVYPFTYLSIGQFTRVSLVRSEFYSGVLALAALAWMSFEQARQGRHEGAPERMEAPSPAV